MSHRPYQNQITDERSALAMDREFIRFMTERQADEQREADRLQHEIETLLAQADAKRQEQTERLNIVAACAAGIAINDKASRPAPVLAARDNPVTEALEQQHANSEDQT